MILFYHGVPPDRLASLSRAPPTAIIGALLQSLVGDPEDVMKVVLRNPKREVEISGKRRVKELLVELDILPGTVLVIRGDELLTSDTVVADDDVLEVRPVMSGGGGGASA